MRQGSITMMAALTASLALTVVQIVVMSSCVPTAQKGTTWRHTELGGAVRRRRSVLRGVLVGSLLMNLHRDAILAPHIAVRVPVCTTVPPVPPTLHNQWTAFVPLRVMTASIMTSLQNSVSPVRKTASGV